MAARTASPAPDEHADTRNQIASLFFHVQKSPFTVLCAPENKYTMRGYGMSRIKMQAICRAAPRGGNAVDPLEPVNREVKDF